MKLVSWNVNGIRAILGKGFLEYLIKEKPDIICLQEIKSQENQIGGIELEELKNMGYELFFNSAKRPGYSGTAIFSKISPNNFFVGMKNFLSNINEDEVICEDIEGRVLTLEFEEFFLVCVYTPNAKRDLERLDFRQIWDENFSDYCKKLSEKKGVIVCGDLNVAHKEIDLKNPSQNKKNAGFTQEERDGMTNFLEKGFVDTFRYFYPEKKDCYTWWSYLGGARFKNIGWRIDYFLVSQNLTEKLEDAFIRDEIMGSDHCPVGITLKN